LCFVYTVKKGVFVRFVLLQPKFAIAKTCNVKNNLQFAVVTLKVLKNT
jgi:hypothetical protein